LSAKVQELESGKGYNYDENEEYDYDHLDLDNEEGAKDNMIMLVLVPVTPQVLNVKLMTKTIIQVVGFLQWLKDSKLKRCVMSMLMIH